MSGGTEGPPDLRSSGERIETLLASFGSSGQLATERAEELVRIVAELYGAGLERLLEIVDEAEPLGPETLQRLADDDLVASLLLVHGLHPYDLQTRIERALEQVRPYLHSHGGDVELLGITAEGVVELRLVGSCKSCPSSSVTLKLAVEGAVEAAAPEISGIVCENAAAEASPTLIPVESLLTRTRPEEPAPVWAPLAAAELRPGEVRGLLVEGVDVVVCQVAGTGYAFRDGCPACASSLAGAALERAPGAPLGSAVLRCPGCRAHYDLRRAGAGLDEPAHHLDPLPLLAGDAGLRIALPGRVPA